MDRPEKIRELIRRRVQGGDASIPPRIQDLSDAELDRLLGETAPKRSREEKGGYDRAEKGGTTRKKRTRKKAEE